MCGISGICQLNKSALPDIGEHLRFMNSILAQLSRQTGFSETRLYKEAARLYYKMS